LFIFKNGGSIVYRKSHRKKLIKMSILEKLASGCPYQRVQTFKSQGDLSPSLILKYTIQPPRKAHFFVIISLHMIRLTAPVIVVIQILTTHLLHADILILSKTEKKKSIHINI